MNDPSRKDRPVLPNGRHVVGIDIGQKFHAAAGVTTAGQDYRPFRAKAPTPALATAR